MRETALASDLCLCLCLCLRLNAPGFCRKLEYWQMPQPSQDQRHQRLSQVLSSHSHATHADPSASIPIPSRWAPSRSTTACLRHLHRQGIREAWRSVHQVGCGLPAIDCLHHCLGRHLCCEERSRLVADRALVRLKGQSDCHPGHHGSAA